jgi:hypothetical protein
MNSSNIYVNVCVYISILFVFYIELLKLDYIIKRYPEWEEAEAIAKHWHIDDFDFHWELVVGILSLRLVDTKIFHL